MSKSILIPVDIEHPESWTRCFDAVQGLFKPEDVSVSALYVLPAFASSLVGSFFPEAHEKEALQLATEKLDAIVTGSSSGPFGEIGQYVMHGEVYPQLIRAAEKLDIDLIVMLAHRPGMGDYLLGSVAARVARHARRSVLLVRD